LIYGGAHAARADLAVRADRGGSGDRTDMTGMPVFVVPPEEWGRLGRPWLLAEGRLFVTQKNFVAFVALGF
jgi:hypothetical protein